MKNFDSPSIMVCRPTKHAPFEAGSLPDSEKERLCRSLLAEFGAENVTVRDDEIIHSCLLPFGAHKNGDRKPSASLNWKKLTYNCLGCGSSGGLLWFIGTCRGVRSSEARKWLNEQTGQGPDEQSLSSLIQFFDDVYGRKNGTKYSPLPKMSAKVLTPWLLIHPYMTEVRRIPVGTLQHFSVGWNRETNRIIIPLFWQGNLVGWQTRRLASDGTPKYKNSPDFPKDQALYNYDPKRKRAVIVESPMSVLSKFHALPDMEATFGASVTDRQVRLIANHRRVVLFLDNDTAGWEATHKLGEALEAYSSVWVVDNPWAADAADMDDRTVLDLVDNAVPFATWRQPKALKEWEVT